jgi:hypothetical protein
MLLKCLLPLIIILAICTGNSSCSKSPLSQPSRVDTISNPPPTGNSSVLVYIGGDTLANGYDEAAAYWKNGSMTILPIGILSYVTSIYVDHNDVYTTIAGASNTDPFTYWKNNQSVSRADANGFGGASYSITMSNGDIYVTGTVHEFPDLNYGAVYWKNNDYGAHLVPQGVAVHQSVGNSIAVSSGDVYIAGTLDLEGVYWKNGNVVHLPLDTSFGYGIQSKANSIFINQGNVYVAGTLNTNLAPSYNIAAYWKNDVAVRFPKGSLANSIFVSGNDIYVAGAICGPDGLPRAAYWKNGIPFILNSNYSIANAIAVDGTDVYVAGDITSLNATYWKNGVPVSLGRGHARSIFIVH